MVGRWWAYQRERFPVFAHGVLIAAFSLSAVGYATVLLGRPGLPAPAAAVAFVTSFLFFFQLRVADEFKDHEQDLRYRPDRPVPRGLVRLRELGLLAALAAPVQLALAVALAPALAVPLVGVWAYLALMTVEFFVPAWLTARPALYLASHLVILPLIALYAAACAWLPAGPAPPGLGWFAAHGYASGAVLEVGRKLRAPRDERPGVNTYSAAWGHRRAAGVWAAALLLSAGCTVMAARSIDFVLPAAAVVGLLLLTAAHVASRFLRAPDAAGAKQLEAFSGAWALGTYLALGVAPVCWHAWSSGGETP